MNTDDQATILCGTDFSENADKAATAAAAIARRTSATLILAHSVDERGEIPDDHRARLLSEDQPQLAAQAARLRESGIVLQERMLTGLPGNGVAQFAGQSAARLVVVGASVVGSNWLGRLLLGGHEVSL